MIATVVKNAGSHFLLSELPEWRPFPAVLRGKVRLQGSRATNPVAVGDRVEYTLPDADQAAASRADLAAPAIITEILPRKNHLIRRSTNLSRESHVIAANIDRAFIIVTLCFPELKMQFLDRILVMCGVYGVPVSIVLNKVDFWSDAAAPTDDSNAATPDELTDFREAMRGQSAEFRRIYEGAGYEVIETSARTGEGVGHLRERVRESGVCLFSGESGVGKSSLIRAIDPALDPKVGSISDAHLQGRHTTSLYEMYPLRAGNPSDETRPSGRPGGFIIDSPGIRGFGLVHLEKEEIARYFPEMLKVSEGCRFVPCTHTHEPDCAVKAAVDEGNISAERYASYLGMLEEEKKFR